MNISAFGHSSFRIKTNNAVIITDPFDKEIGIHFPKNPADIVTISHSHKDHSNRDGIKNEDAFFIEGPGEYEIKEVMIKGLRTFHDNQQGAERGVNTIYLFEAEDLTVCHLGDLGHELSEKILKEVESVDILMIPIGGVYTIDPQTAIKIIKQIEPSIVIPMHYKEPGMSAEFDKLATLDDFLKEFELEPVRTDKLSITATTLPEEMGLIVLER